MPRIAVIGAGAAGCFCAIHLKRMMPGADVRVLEAGPKPLAKVAVTGGGRCNLSNSFEGIRSLEEAYPRGARLMKRALKAFSVADTLAWFEAEGVPLVLQEDHCWFPRSQDAMDIVRALTRAMDRAGVRVECGHPVRSIEAGFRVDGEPFDQLVVTTGGAPHGLPFLAPLELDIIPPVPSLFTFTVPDPALRSLMGLVTEVSVSLSGTAFKASGALLITDWGLSGPAILKLSSYAARHLAEQGYQGNVAINWLHGNEASVRALLEGLAAAHPQKQVASTHPVQARLWEHLLERAGMRPGIRWAELGSKGMNRLIATLTNDCYPLTGKSRFREEFVTCGGVALGNLDLNTLESKRYPGLCLAGEVLDVDAITGGFNLQAAWSTAFVAARTLAARNA